MSAAQSQVLSDDFLTESSEENASPNDRKASQSGFEENKRQGIRGILKPSEHYHILDYS